MDRLQAVLKALDNDKTKLVIDLSCRRKDNKWFVATNKWQTITDFELNQGTHTQPPSFLPQHSS
jgi:phosphoribosylformimino-5-aminoimidazole carboxamide ribotide isomerase